MELRLCSCCTGAFSKHVFEQQQSIWATRTKLPTGMQRRLLDQCLKYSAGFSNQLKASVQKAASNLPVLEGTL